MLALLLCTLLNYSSGKPAPTVSWAKDGKEIKDGDRFSVKNDGDKATLTIKDATEADTGKYKVTAKSSAGEVTTEVEVKVESKQVKPT